MEQQARLIANWGTNVYVKVPVTNTHGESSAKVVRRLVAEGVRLNVTALTTGETIRLCRRFEELDVTWIEEPADPFDVGALKKISAK